MTLEERFWSKVDVREENECWEWKAARIRGGYGQFKPSGHRSTTTAHRTAWALTYGDIPPGIHCCHHCDNPPCCNPAHLFLGTRSDNMRDMYRKGRHRIIRLQGEQHPLSILTVPQVLEICRLLDETDETHQAIGAMFGVARTCITDINTGYRWDWLTGRGA